MVAASLTIEDILKKTTDLPSIPAAALAVMREADSDTGTARTVANHIAQDQALTARVLRLSNSAYYGLSRQVSDIQEAVVVLGMRAVRNLAVVAATYPWLSKGLKGYALDPKQMWTHSFGVAVGGQLCAKRSGKVDPDLVFTAGLLHNIGKVALSVWLENRTTAILKMAQQKELTFDQVERLLFGFDHAEIGAHLGEQWNLPMNLVQAIRWHHEPNRCDPTSPVVDCIHLGDYLTMSLGYGLGADGLRYDLATETLTRLGLNQLDMDEVISDFVDQYRAYEKLFEEMG